MKTLTWIDKSGWPEGVWKQEPDKAEWTDERTGLACLAVRQEHSGHWCGYVGVPEPHPLFGLHYDSVNVKAHGGLTFADFCQENDKERGVCHSGPERVFWFGFDCAHAWDWSPLRSWIGGEGVPASYRTLEYVREECRNLARQLAKVKCVNGRIRHRVQKRLRERRGGEALAEATALVENAN